MGIKFWSFPDQELNPGTLHWLRGVLATGPPGKSRTLQLVTASGLGVTTEVTLRSGGEHVIFSS